MRDYQLTDPELQAAVDGSSGIQCLKILSQQLALLNALIRQRLNLAKTDAEKIQAFNYVHPAQSTLDKLANTITRLEKHTSEALSKESARRLAEQIIEILMDELSDIDDRDRIIDRISQRIAEAIMKAENE